MVQDGDCTNFFAQDPRDDVEKRRRDIIDNARKEDEMDQKISEAAEEIAKTSKQKGKNKVIIPFDPNRPVQ